MWLDTKYDKIADWKRNQLNIRAVAELRYQTRNYPSFTLLQEKKRIQSVHKCQPSIYIYLLLRYWWYQSSLTFSCLISKVLQNWQTQAQIIWSKYFFSITWTINTCDTSSFLTNVWFFNLNRINSSLKKFFKEINNNINIILLLCFMHSIGFVVT